LTISPGTNLVADQFCQVDDGVMHANGTYALGVTMNDLYGLFYLDAWAANTDLSAIYEWNGNRFDGDTNGSGIGAPYWNGGGNLTMLPGASVLMYNPTGSAYPIWFTGLIRNQQIFSLQAGINYLSATAPLAGAVTNITGYNPPRGNGDIVELWNTSSNKFISHTNTSSGWSGGVPTLSVGQGFVLISANAYTWTNTW